MTRNEKSPGRNGSDGFSTLELLAAMFVITIALTGLLSLFGYAISTMSLMQDLLIAKQKSRETLESIYTARNTSQITFDMIQNDNVADGIFLEGYQSLKRPGNDGLIGTSDEGAIETLTLPGPDGDLMLTADNEFRVLDTFERQIQISPILFADSSVNPDVRRIMVSIRYNTPMGGQSTYAVESYISRYR